MILCVMRIPPARDGHGGSQRAWFLLHALRRLAPVHFVLISRKTDHDAAIVPLDPVRPLVESVTHIDIPEWNPVSARLGPIHRDWAHVVRMRSQDAPSIGAPGLRRIAEQLPIRSADMVFAGRLPTAVILQDMMDRGLVSAGRRFVDFDDIMSKFVKRRLQVEGPSAGRQGRALLRFDAAYLRRAEGRIASSWDGVSVCTDEDVQGLQAAYPRSQPWKVPNVVDRDLLPPRPEDGRIKLLFVGNLGNLPNQNGLLAFARDAWPRIKAALPQAVLTVVGINPGQEVKDVVARHGYELHADVPDLRPYYEQTDLVISPILIGSGTRIKILEAMAYGRPVVSTVVGAEGLGLEHGRHAMLTHEVAGFADAVLVLARDREARLGLAAEARAFQQRHYGPDAMDAALAAAMGSFRPVHEARRA